MTKDFFKNRYFLASKCSYSNLVPFQLGLYRYNIMMIRCTKYAEICAFEISTTFNIILLT